MNCLKDGLISLGHEVFLASNGDFKKNYPSDFRWDKCVDFRNQFTQFFFAGNIWWHKELLRGYDVVLLMDPHIVSSFRFVNDPIYKYLIRNNNKAYLSGSGDTKMMFDFWYNSDTKYKHYYEGYVIDNPNYKFLVDKKGYRQWEEELLSLIDGYIPIWYEYAEPFRSYQCIKKTIRIPVALNSQEYRPNIVKGGKVIFYHGITRACKGTRYIKAAFEKMQKYYSDKAEFILAGMLPFDEYMKVVEKTNVIVDDANSYSIAMNGLFSLLKGKLVMGGAEDVANKELGIAGVNPVFNICPDIEQICETMIHIIENKEHIVEWGEQGRNFVENYHNSIEIARQYEQLWIEDLNKK